MEKDSDGQYLLFDGLKEEEDILEAPRDLYANENQLRIYQGLPLMPREDTVYGGPQIPRPDILYK